MIHKIGDRFNKLKSNDIWEYVGIGKDESEIEVILYFRRSLTKPHQNIHVLLFRNQTF